MEQKDQNIVHKRLQMYRTWVTNYTQRIEKADNRGDTRAIYTEVKRLSVTVSRGVNTRPTATYKTLMKAEKLKI